MIKSNFPNLPKPIEDYSIKLENYPEEHQKRLFRLKTVCQDKNHGYPDKPTILQEYKDILNREKLTPANEPKFFYSPKGKIIYCSLTKCGSSNWRVTIRDVERLFSAVHV